MYFQRLLISTVLVFIFTGCVDKNAGTNNSLETSLRFSVEDELDHRSELTVNQALEIVPPAQLQQRATGVLTPITLGQPLVNNAIGAVEVRNNAPANGFPVGETIVEWSVVDATGTLASATQVVTINADVACSTSELFFEQRVWPLIDKYCMECHTNNNVSSALNFVNIDVANYLNINFNKMKSSSVLLDNNNESLFLNKIINKNNDHGGDTIFSVSSTEYLAFESMVERFNMCGQVINFSPDLVLLSPLQQLRKVTLALASRLPNLNEVSIINNANSLIAAKEMLDIIIDGLFLEKAFYQRLKEIYNDVLLTDAFNTGAKALGLPLNDFDNRNYFGTTVLMQQGYNGTDSNLLRKYANYGISQAPLELISYVVKNDLPFTEILTADYLMVNPYSATIFGAVVPGEPNFNFVYGADWNLYDYERFLPVKLVDNKGRNIPHAGVLTSLPFLSRYPSTSTNLNRKRARYVFQYFLDTDIEGLASRGGLDLGNTLGLIPTLEDPQCTVCHDVLDPIAGLFKNWNVGGRFLGNNLNWLHTRQPQEMVAPGFNRSINDLLPDSESATALRWLASRISADNRFVTSTVKTVFKGLTNIDLADDPVFFQSLKTTFITHNFNLKKLIKEIVTSPYFLVENVVPSGNTGQVSNFGTAHLLTPEHLDRKIKAIFNGKVWVSPNKRNLLSQDSYLLLYGGIDSKQITKRTRQQTSLMSGIQVRIANQLACELVPQDLNKPISQRELFPFININQVPDNAQNTQLIKQNIQYLFTRILGREMGLSDPEIERAYTLFVSVMATINANYIDQDCQGDLLQSNPIVIDALYTVRAWMAVVNYLIRDYYFYYE